MVAVLAAYYVMAWLLVGRKRAVKSIAVRYEPPANLSPAAVRYIYTMACDGRSYAPSSLSWLPGNCWPSFPTKSRVQFTWKS